MYSKLTADYFCRLSHTLQQLLPRSFHSCLVNVLVGQSDSEPMLWDSVCNLRISPPSNDVNAHFGIKLRPSVRIHVYYVNCFIVC